MTTKPLVFLGRVLTASVVVCIAVGLAKADTPEKNKDIEAAGDAFQKGNIAKALELLEKAQKGDKTQTLPPAKLMLARFFLAVNNPSAEVRQAMRVWLEEAAKENPKNPAVYLTNANVAVMEGRWTEAIMCCETALKYTESGTWDAKQKKTFKADANGGLGAVAAARKEWDKAREYLSDVLKLDPTNAVARHNYARALFMLDSSKEADALKELETAFKDRKAQIEKDKPKEEPILELPEASLASFWLNKEIKVDAEKLKVKDSDPEKAKEATAKAIKKAQDKIAEEYSEKVQKWYGKAVVRDATDKEKVQAHLVYGDWLLNHDYLDKGFLDKARYNAQAAIDIVNKFSEKEKNKSLPACLRLSGLIARANGEYTKAGDYFRTLQYSSPADWGAANQLALILADSTEELEKLNYAMQLAEENVKKYPRMAEGYSTLGWVCFRKALVEKDKNLFARAVECLNKSISNGHATPDTAYFLARIRDHRWSETDPKKEKTRIDLNKDVKNLLEKALETKALFNYREAANDLLKEVNKRPAGK